MNNVKTNRTKEHAWAGEPDINWTTKTKEIYYRGWERALENVVQEPALTMDETDIRDTITDAAFEAGGSGWERDFTIDGLLDLASKVLSGRIPAPATVEAPQKGELTRDWLETWGATSDAILTRHQQALSAREQAVRGEYQISEWHMQQDKFRAELAAELAAEKLANEGPRWGDVFEIVSGGIRSRVQLVALNLKGDIQDASIWYTTSAVEEVDWKPTLTPAEKAEAWVKWYCAVGEKAARYSEFDAWKELATRQANGETIEQLYRRDVLGAPKEQEES